MGGRRSQAALRLRESVHEIKVPVLVVGGDVDERVEMRDVLLDYLALSEEQRYLHIFHGVGHSPNLEIPQELASLIASFIDRVDALTHIVPNSVVVYLRVLNIPKAHTKRIVTNSKVLYYKPIGSYGRYPNIEPIDRPVSNGDAIEAPEVAHAMRFEGRRHQRRKRSRKGNGVTCQVQRYPIGANDKRCVGADEVAIQRGVRVYLPRTTP